MKQGTPFLERVPKFEKKTCFFVLKEHCLKHPFIRFMHCQRETWNLFRFMSCSMNQTICPLSLVLYCLYVLETIIKIAIVTSQKIHVEKVVLSMFWLSWANVMCDGWPKLWVLLTYPMYKHTKLCFFYCYENMRYLVNALAPVTNYSW